LFQEVLVSQEANGFLLPLRLFGSVGLVTHSLLISILRLRSFVVFFCCCLFVFSFYATFSCFAPNYIPTILLLYLQIIVLSCLMPNQARYSFYAHPFLIINPSCHALRSLFPPYNLLLPLWKLGTCSDFTRQN